MWVGGCVCVCGCVCWTSRSRWDDPLWEKREGGVFFFFFYNAHTITIFKKTQKAMVNDEEVEAIEKR